MKCEASTNTFKINTAVSKKLLTYLFTVLFSLNLSAQTNLVPNPSFEEYISYPTNPNQIYNSLNWSSFGNSSDYFHACSPSSIVSVPNNGWGYQFSSTGDSYCGVYTYIGGSSPLYREFIGTQLLSPLTVGERYYIRFQVSLGDEFNCATNKIGVLFSTISYNDTIIVPINNFAHFYSDSILIDSTNWMTVSGSFVADSSYQYIIIGNFSDNPTVNCATNKLGVLFSTISYALDTFCINTTLLVPPNFAHIYTDSIITDTMLWTNITGSFTADSNYQYIVIGNFFDDNNTDTICNGGNLVSYYFIDDVYVAVDSMTVIVENELQKEINIYPNPTKHNLSIKIYDLEKIQCIMKIYDMLGKLKGNYLLQSSENNIKLPNLRAGIYIIEFQFLDKTFKRKLVITD